MINLEPGETISERRARLVVNAPAGLDDAGHSLRHLYITGNCRHESPLARLDNE